MTQQRSVSIAVLGSMIVVSILFFGFGISMRDIILYGIGVSVSLIALSITIWYIKRNMDQSQPAQS